jgi:hypothetical protein
MNISWYNEVHTEEELVEAFELMLNPFRYE